MAMPTPCPVVLPMPSSPDHSWSAPIAVVLTAIDASTMASAAMWLTSTSLFSASSCSAVTSRGTPEAQLPFDIKAMAKGQTADPLR